MARIACPDSKRGSIRELKDRFDIELFLPAVYSMMRLLDDKRTDLGCELVEKPASPFYESKP